MPIAIDILPANVSSLKCRVPSEFTQPVLGVDGTLTTHLATVAQVVGGLIIAGDGLYYTVLTPISQSINVGAGDGIDVAADSVTVKLDGTTLVKSAAGLKVGDHAFNGNTYGYGDATLAGHLRVGTGIGIAAGTISVNWGITNITSCRGDDVRLADARTPVGTALTSANIWVGSAGNVAAAVAMSGDVTIINTGATALKPSLKTGTIFLLPQQAKIRTTGGCGALTSAETATNKQNYYCLPFARSADAYANWAIAMPDNWDAGTFTATLYWQSTSTTNGQTVRWSVQGFCYTDLDLLDEVWGAAVNTDDTTDGSITKIFQITSAAVTLAGTRGAGKYALIQVGRLGTADTNNGTCNLLGVKLTYTMV